MFKGLSAIVGLVLSAALLLVLAFNLPAGKAFLRDQLVEQARARAPGLQIGGLGGALPFSISLDDVKLADRFGTPTVRIERIYLRPTFWPLLVGRIELAELRVEEPTLILQSSHSGELNVSELLLPSQSGAQESSDWAVAVRKLVVRGGRLRNEAQGVDARALRLDAQFVYHPDETGYAELDRLQGKLETQGRHLTVDLHARARRGAHGVRLQAQAALREREHDARAKAELLVHGTLADLRGYLELTSPRGGSLTVRGEVERAGEAVQPHYELSLRVHDLNPQRMFSKLPQADIRAHAHVTGSGTPLQAGSQLNAELELAPSMFAGVRPVSARARLSARDEHWQLPALSAQAGAMTLALDAHGSRDLAVGALDVRAQGDVPWVSDAGVHGSLHVSGQGPLPTSGAPSAPLKLDATLDLARAHLGELQVRDAALELSAHADQLYASALPQDAALSLRAEPFVVNGQRIERLHVTAQRSGRQLEANLVAKPAHAAAATPLRASLRGRLAPGKSLQIDPASLRGELSWRDVPVRFFGALLAPEVRTRGRCDLLAQLTGDEQAFALELGVRLRSVRVGSRGPISGVLQLRAEPEQLSTSLSATYRGHRALTLNAQGDFGTSALWRGQLDQVLARPFTLEARVPPLSLQRLLADPHPKSGESGAGVTGALSAQLNVTGSLGAPVLTLHSQVADAAVSGTRLGFVELDATGAVRDAQSQAKVRLALAGAQLLRAQLTSPWTPSSLRQPEVEGAPTFHLSADIPNYPLWRLSKENPGWGEVRGSLSGEISAYGTLAEPRGQLVLRGHSLRFKEKDLGAVRLALALRGRSLRTQLSLEQPDGGSLQVAGWGKAPGKLKAQAVLDRLDLGFLPAYAKLKKTRASARVAVVGSLAPYPSKVAQSAEAAAERGAKSPDKLAAELTIDIDDARVPVPLSPSPGKKAEPPPEWQLDDSLRKLLPLRVRRLAIRHAQIDLVANATAGNPTLSFRDLSLTLENLATRDALFHGGPSVLGLRACFERGVLVAFATLDPMAEQATFAAQAELRELSLAAVNNYLGAKLGVLARKGKFSAVARFEAHDGKLNGAVKPVVVSPEIVPAHSTFKSRLKAGLADAVELVLPDKLGNKSSEAALVPLEGELTQPHVQLLPVVLSVLQDAMLVGFSRGAGDALPWQLPVENNLVEPRSSWLAPRAPHLSLHAATRRPR